MRWWPRRRSEATNLTIETANPLVMALFGAGIVDGISVGEGSALGLSAMYRAVSLISGTLASLPLRTLREDTDGQREKVPSVFDDPDGPDGQTVFEWKETLFIHLLLHGKAGAIKVRTEAGGLSRLALVHPASFAVAAPSLEEYANPEKMPRGGIWFDVSLNDGSQKRMDAEDFWYVPAASTDLMHGMGLIRVAQASLSTSIAAEKSARKAFTNGALIAGIATPADDNEDITDDVPEIRRQIDNTVQGPDNAGAIVIVNKRLTFTPWTMTMEQAQFIQSRQFQVEEISRWTGVPPHLLMQTEKSTSWGTGIEEQNRALGRTVLSPWASRAEHRGSRLLAKPRWIEFDFSALERPSPDKEIELLLAQTGKPIMTVNEARKIRNLPPIVGGDDMAAPAPAAPPAPDDDEEEDDDAPPPGE
jgi:HK97 family phage portal protein